MHEFRGFTLGVAVLSFACVAVAPARASFVAFESGQVRPLALAPDGSRLFAVNTPDNRLEIFDVSGAGGLLPVGSVPVGLEPVAVAVRPGSNEVWVVNHLSDSISIVEVGVSPPRVLRTLLVGDEPRDIVFAGAGGQRAFITTAHRGQNTPFHTSIDTILKTPGIGRADVWVFDTTDLGSDLGGTPLTILTLFGDTPRALAVSPDGNTVYAAVFHSGNQTSVVSEGVVCDDPDLTDNTVAGPCVILGESYPGGMPLPETNFAGVPRPETGLIVKYNEAAGEWQDELGRNWNNGVKLALPDKDIFAIDAGASPMPVELGSFAHVGTVLFDMAVNPVDGTVYVTNTDARNEVRFEGPGVFAGTTVRGHLHEARVTVLSGSSVLPRHLNKHIDYSVVPSPPAVAADSLATPLGMAVTSDGTTLYVAAFGSAKIGVYDTTQLALDTFVPATVPHISVSGGGPSGLVLNEPRNRLYAFIRFDNSISVIDTQTNTEIAHLPVYNPEPVNVTTGRPFFYDARFTSSNGEASCSSCHVFGDFDSLGWDLGNPDGDVLENLNPFRVVDPGGSSFPDHHPMKGPMATQSLRGMANHGPMHWRGDRSGANDPGGDALDEQAAFKRFNVAFQGLLGREGPLSATEMQHFTDFILDVTYPPNPNRNLDNTLTPDQQLGHDFFMNNTAVDLAQPCHGCHVVDPAQGQFASNGFSTFEGETQLFKIPHLRNHYQKVGMFGMPDTAFFNAFDNGDTGAQVRGFGFLHDGTVDTIFRFMNLALFNQCAPVFGCVNPGGFLNDPLADPRRRQVEAFLFVFDSNLAPIVGQQITLSSANAATVAPRIALLIQRAETAFTTLGQANAKECDLVVKGTVGGEARGWQYWPSSAAFRSDRATEPLVMDGALQALAAVAGQELTYTCVPPGSGPRIGIDHDEDGYFDRDELDACSDPADPSSIPSPGGCTGCRLAGKSVLRLRTRAGQESLTWKWLKGAATDVSAHGNPVTGATGYRLRVYAGPANDLIMEADVPAQGICDGGPCWETRRAGLKYKDATLANDGVLQVQLTAGTAGSAKTQITGKGAGLPLPVLPAAGLALPVTVRLSNSDSDGGCWEATYPAAATNHARAFKARF